MGALPRPDLPPGPHRDLVDALHDLHHRAGWPSLRTLAKKTGVSHTTVSKAFSTPTLPSWGTLELLVEAMGGDTAAFHHQWVTATSPPAPTLAAAPRIAGRRRELAVVRRHLETGTGLLLVLGEAGMGKTTLVTTAAATTDVFVATGHCLPLSAGVPLLPVADVLRDVFESDGGRWIRDAVEDCPTWVPGTLGRLLPELAPDPARATEDASLPHLMGVAVRSLLGALGSRRPLSITIEDLHWADTATLELLEQLLTRATAPLLGTWRLDDGEIGAAPTDWFTRVRRMPTVTTLSLVPLDVRETGEQLVLLTGRPVPPALVRATYERSRGLPMFTEQLAAHGPEADGLPSLLSDLLDARLKPLTERTWAVARTLGVADRPLATDLVAAGSGLGRDEVGSALRELADRTLLSDEARPAAALRHPLLAEAIRRRLLPGEAEIQHAGLARALAGSADPAPAEVARHWHLAGDVEQELAWRIRAARAAHDRFALRHEVDQWVRALALWPRGRGTAGDPPMRRYEALVAALDLVGGITGERARVLVDDALALVPDLAPLEAAELLQRVGDHLSSEGEIERGLELVSRALDAYDAAPPCEGHVRALFVLEFTLRKLGRLDESAAAVERGVRVAAQLPNLGWYRRMLVQRAWFAARDGDREVALKIAREAAEVEVVGPDPRGEALLAGTTTDILLLTAADVEDVVSAGTRGLDAVAPWGLDTYAVHAIRLNMAVAMRRAGQVRRASEFIRRCSDEGGGRPRDRVFELERAPLEMLEGRSERALALVAELDELRLWSGLEDRIEVDLTLAEVELWTGRSAGALRRLVHLARAAAPTESARDVGAVLAYAARAAADCRDPAAHRTLVTLRRSCSVDPFESERGPFDRRAWGRTWTAEMARLGQEETTEDWRLAAAEWDALGRPHEAAYCRWRGAQVALRAGHGTLASRLLVRGASDAREHAPLSQAIAATRAGVR
jgi:tetratricopeptide (TPR) repeat protein